VLARAQLLICNDAGARHVAAAFEVPTLVLMGPTAVGYTNLNLKRTKILREPVACSPCQLKVGPIDHRCMTRILPARVRAEARDALQRTDWRGSVELELGA
jgi:heptosyltransferase-2